MVQQEKRLLWHPRQENRFLVGGGSQITLYEWFPNYPEIRHVTSQQDLQYMKCFGWSPDPTLDDLVAVGVNTGRVDLIRLEAAKHTRGEKLSSGPTVSLAVRNSRTCNAVAFCNADPNYLAVGLDKVRGDCSLVLWDIASAIPLLSLDPTLSQDATAAVATSLGRPQPLLPRFETNPRNDPRILQQYAPQEIVSCISFLPKSTHLLLAGISHRWLRLFDLRTPSPNIMNIPGKIQAIATDPFDQHRVASIGDNTASVWDIRKLASPLMFSERDATADKARLRPGSMFSGVEFSSTRRGCLATLERESPYVRFWDLMDIPVISSENTGLGITGYSRESGRTPARRSWAATLPWQTSGPQQIPGAMRERTPSMDSNTSTIVVANTRRTKAFSKPLSSFALVPNPTSRHPLTSNVMVVNKDGDLELYALYDAPKQSAWSARGDFTFGSGVNLKTVPGSRDSEMASQDLLAAREYRVNNASEYGRGSQSHSIRVRDDSLGRGRVVKSQSLVPPPIVPPVLFGRGDEDGFPALNSTTPVAPTGLAATRPQKGLTYSPAALQKYQGPERSDQRHRSRSSVRQHSLPRGEPMPMSGEGGLIGQKLEESERAKRRQDPKDGENKDLVRAVEDDISMFMRRRAILGYGLSRPPQNMWITREQYNPQDIHSQGLSDLWAWVLHSQQLLCTPVARVHGYDFAHQGILGIWDGLPPLRSQMDNTPIAVDRSLPGFGVPSHERSGSGKSFSPNDEMYGSFQTALSVIESRKTGEKSAWKPTVSTSKSVHRQVAMKLCGWSLKEDELSAAISRWEKEGQHARAAAWLVFTRQFSKALDMLLKSNDMSHKVMSGTIAALVPHGTNSTPLRNHDLREHCERLIKDMKDPYFCAILTYLAVGDWADVLKEESIPLRERLAIALQFLEDKPLSTYLRHVIENAIAKGDIEGLIVTGLTHLGMDILQAYVDNTGDVQTAAILGSYVCPHRIRDSRVIRWLDTYRDMLDGFKLHHPRVLFDIERGQILTEAMQNGDIPHMELVPKQVLIRCNYCNKPVAPEEELGLTEQAKWRPTTCSNCQRLLPRCSVCLLTLSIVPDAAREIELVDSPQKDTIDDAIVLCQTCRHGGHASHLMEWFFGEGQRSRGVCPVADCDCRCADEF